MNMMEDKNSNHKVTTAAKKALKLIGEQES
jgi:hypothetical protein